MLSNEFFALKTSEWCLNQKKKNIKLKTMTTQMHLAAQYLAAASISFLDKKEDDSHTNLGYSIETKRLSTRPLTASGISLSLNYDLFALEWFDNSETNTLRLEGTTHIDVLQWIREMIKHSNLNKTYDYKLHYELPYTINDDYVFRLEDTNRLKELIQYRTLAQLVLQDFLQKHKLKSEIRIWPHHFDTGAFSTIENSKGLTIGLGLAIPDTMCNDYYFYISGYKGHESLTTISFKPLTRGNWFNDNFKGAVLPVSKIEKNEGVTFFDEALVQYLNHVS